MKLNVLKGSTNYSLDIFIQDSSSTTGAGLTGLVFNSSGLVCYYRRGGTGTVTQLTLATQTVGGAHSDGGFVELSSSNMPGMYRLDLSDAVIATGVPWVSVMLKGATNMAALPIEIQLVDYDAEDGVRLGLTALPNAAAGAAGGLPTDSTGKTSFNDLSAAQVNTECDTALTDYDAVIPADLNDPTAAAIADAVWDELQSAHVTSGSFGETATEIADILVDTNSLNDTKVPDTISLANINGEVDTALADVNLDHLVGTAAPGIAPAGTYLDILADDGTATYDRTTDSLQAIRDRGDTSWITGGGGGITDILNVIPAIPNDIDLADTATVRLGLILTNAVDDLPTTAEITPGTISIHRKAIGGTSWSAVVTDGACSEQAGMVYFDEVFDSGTGYAEGDSIRVTFKSQKITVAANDYEVTDANGVMFQTSIRQTMRGTDSAFLASADGSTLTEAGGTGDHLTGIPWNSAWDVEVESEATDALNAYDPPTRTELTSDINGLNDPTAAAVADAVWDEAKADHTTATSFGDLATDLDSVLADTGTDGVVVAAGSKTGYSIGTGGITAGSFAAGAVDAAALAADAVDEILDEQIGDSTVTVRQAMKLLVSTLGGKLSGAATTTVTIRNVADDTDVVTATVDADGNRSAVTLSL